jgi:hypothetical protein
MKKNTRKRSNLSRLERFLADSRSDKYFGKSFCFKCAILAQVLSGVGTLTEIAREHRVSKQAASRHAASARAIFGSGKHQVDCKPLS